MNETGRAILEALDEVGGISALVLFGSRAGSGARPDSDLDVAVLPATELKEPRRKLQARVAASLAYLVPDGRVDVVFIDEAPELLRQRILEGGMLLIAREPERWRELRVSTMREHGDREHYRRMLRLGLKRKLEGADRGRS